MNTPTPPSDSDKDYVFKVPEEKYELTATYNGKEYKTIAKAGETVTPMFDGKKIVFGKQTSDNTTEELIEAAKNGTLKGIELESTAHLTKGKIVYGQSTSDNVNKTPKAVDIEQNMSTVSSDKLLEETRERVMDLPEYLRKELLYLAHMNPDDKSTFMHNVAVAGENITRHHQALIKTSERKARLDEWDYIETLREASDEAMQASMKDRLETLTKRGEETL